MTCFTLKIVLFSLTFLKGLHDEHYSVTNIDITNKTDTIAIAIKLNAHDLVFALAHNYKELNDNTTLELSQINDTYIANYVLKVLTLKINNTPTPLNYLKKEVNDNDIWLYLSGTVKTDITNIEVMNALFFDIFTDQVNLAIISHNEIEKGYKTTFYERTFIHNINPGKHE